MNNPQDVMVELQNKQHIKICPVNFLSSIFPSTTNSKCVVGFEDMDPNRRNVSVRSDQLAHEIHLEKSEKGILEPLCIGFTAMGFGIGLWVAFLGVLALWTAVARTQAFKVICIHILLCLTLI